MVFPNPADNAVRIQIDPAFRKENELQLSILNTVGDVVLHINWKTWKELEVDVRNLHDGMYYLNVYGERMNAIKKIVIVH
ncbi:MAG: T9SS type A sorting domain-containing protein [Saprospiraceae bacterium]|uniref:T9SS type A sorting domain-containing protein n=1 Tax=Candidatus Opimibacter skivensis TaxID=2982028 RepID=A0A9D7XNH1_9BACT|nr:T9SS type A sorting domain-containing protein [Candidatus Opimibacter skivensis]